MKRGEAERRRGGVGRVGEQGETAGMSAKLKSVEIRERFLWTTHGGDCEDKSSRICESP